MIISTLDVCLTLFPFLPTVCLSVCLSAGAEGNVDGSLQLLKEVEEIKLKKKQAEDEYHALIPRHAVQQQKLKACEVSHSVQLHPTIITEVEFNYP